MFLFSSLSYIVFVTWEIQIIDIKLNQVINKDVLLVIQIR